MATYNHNLVTEDKGWRSAMTKPKLSWLSAPDAIKLIEKNATGSILDATGVIFKGLSKGRLSCRGMVEHFPERPSDRLIECYRSSSQRGSNLTKIKYMRNQKKPPLKSIKKRRYRWRFHGENACIVAGPGNHGQDWIVLSKIELRENDLNSYLTQTLFWTHEVREGRTRDSLKWLAITLALLKLERDEKLNHSDIESAPILVDRVLALSGLVLDERTVSRDLGIVYDLLVTENPKADWLNLPWSDSEFDTNAAIESHLLNRPRLR